MVIQMLDFERAITVDFAFIRVFFFFKAFNNSYKISYDTINLSDKSRQTFLWK